MRIIVLIAVAALAIVCTNAASAGFASNTIGNREGANHLLRINNTKNIDNKSDSTTIPDSTALESSNTAHITHDSLSKHTLIYDSSTVVEKSLSKNDLKEFLNDKEFEYDRTSPDQTSLWDMLKDWFWEIIARIFGTKIGGQIGDALVYILIAAAIVIVNIILFRSNLGGLFGGKNSKRNIGFTILDENIHELNFPELITSAETKGDYRHAIRLHYLWLLKRLSDDSVIQLKINKTNRDYRNEITQPDLQQSFSRASIVFEYVWYGDVKIDSGNYQSAVQLFASPVTIAQ